MKLQIKRILALAPHADDIELGCGASLSRFQQEGAVVKYVVFSICEEWVPKGFPLDVLLSEATASAMSLGVSSENIHILRLRATELSKHREKIFDTLFDLNASFVPDLVFCPAICDLHQDHACIGLEAERVFKNRILLGYEVPWNNTKFSSNCHIRVSESDMNNKIEALNHFKSQFHKSYVNEEFIMAQARFRGGQIKETYAEAFEVMKVTI